MCIRVFASLAESASSKGVPSALAEKASQPVHPCPPLDDVVCYCLDNLNIGICLPASHCQGKPNGRLVCDLLFVIWCFLGSSPQCKPDASIRRKEFPMQLNSCGVVDSWNHVCVYSCIRLARRSLTHNTRATARYVSHLSAGVRRGTPYLFAGSGPP